MCFRPVGVFTLRGQHCNHNNTLLWKRGGNLEQRYCIWMVQGEEYGGGDAMGMGE